MLFNTLEYLLFLPVVLALFFALPKRLRWVLLLIASYLFYMSWRPDFALLILFSTLVDYVVGLQMDRIPERRKRRKWLAISLVANLGLLLSFKYLGFLNETIRAGFTELGWKYDLDRLDILLPVGISFYTFQTLSYSIDMYRGKRRAEKHFGYFALYVSFFPQLVAGPIERSEKLLPQLRNPKDFDLDRIISGGRLVIWGLFKKIIIADHLALLVNQVYGNPDQFGGNMLWLASAAFMIQLYADFSGYCDMAIGSARMLGVDLSTNFNRPFAATNVAGVWRRWHITLYQWLRDYLYIPLGGSRVSAWRWRLNVLIVFVVIGVWHGAAWGFFWFGVIHALLVITQRITGPHWRKLGATLGPTATPAWKRYFDRAYTFVLWVLAVIIFRAESVDDGLYIYSHLFTGGGLLRYQYVLTDFKLPQLIIVASGLMVMWWVEARSRNIREPFSGLQLRPIRWSLYLLLLFALLVFDPRTREAFLYFQF